MRKLLKVELSRRAGLFRKEQAQGFIDTGGKPVRTGDKINLDGTAWTVTWTHYALSEIEVPPERRLGRIQ